MSLISRREKRAFVVLVVLPLSATLLFLVLVNHFRGVDAVTIDLAIRTFAIFYQLAALGYMLLLFSVYLARFFIGVVQTAAGIDNARWRAIPWPLSDYRIFAAFLPSILTQEGRAGQRLLWDAAAGLLFTGVLAASILAFPLLAPDYFINSIAD